MSNNDFYFWWFDEFVKQWITLYYFPYWLAGHIDDYQSLGVTLNGSRPVSVKLRQP